MQVLGFVSSPLPSLPTNTRRECTSGASPSLSALGTLILKNSVVARGDALFFSFRFRVPADAAFEEGVEMRETEFFGVDVDAELERDASGRFEVVDSPYEFLREERFQRDDNRDFLFSDFGFFAA